MYDKVKVQELQRQIREIEQDLEDYAEESQGFYFDYDLVENLLTQIKVAISNTLHCQNPKY